ncbi:MAG: hypothetical protein IIW94_01150 [Clostridia bacterium]|nr:hypothetical protein [Clostridia bacterium]
MKKMTAILLAVLFLFAAAACKKLPASNPNPSPSLPVASFEEVSEPSSSGESSSGFSSMVSSSDSSSDDYSDTSSSEPYLPPPTTPLNHSDHHCYSYLTDIQKQYYNSMHTAAEQMHASWVVLGPLTENYTADVAVVRHALVTDHPDIFWLPPYYVTASGTDADDNPAALIMFSSSAEVSPSYNITRAEKAYMEQELTTAVALIISQVTSSDPFEIELQLHDMLCQKVTYSLDPSDPYIYTAYGALVNGSALCEGYSRAMQLLLNQFDIQSTTISGVAAGAGHMWNAVKIGEDWHHLDATWNDTATGFISHEYFGLTDEEILKDHVFANDSSALTPEELASGAVSFNTFRPVCTNGNYNFFLKKGFVFGAENLSELAEYVANATENAVEVKFSDPEFKEQFAQNSETVLQELSSLLALNHGANYYIGRYSVSVHTLKLYKTV